MKTPLYKDTSSALYVYQDPISKKIIVIVTTSTKEHVIAKLSISEEAISNAIEYLSTINTKIAPVQISIDE